MSKKATTIKEPDEVSRVPDYIEYGVKGDYGDCIVTRSVFLKIKDGPGVPLQVGKIVRLTPPTAKLLFFHCKSVVPLGMRNGDEYEFMRLHRYVDSNGLYQEIKPGARARLTVDEAVDLLRQMKIKLPDEGDE